MRPIWDLASGITAPSYYLIKNKDGLTLGRIAERKVALQRRLTRQLTAYSRIFLLGVFNNDNELILIIERGFIVRRSNVRVLLPRPSVKVQRSSNRPSASTDCSKQSRTQNLASLAASMPRRSAVTLVSQMSLALPLVPWTEVGRVLRPFNGDLKKKYTMRMDPTSFEDISQHYSKVRDSLTLDQHALLLTNTMSIDFDYFTIIHSVGGNRD